MVKESPDPADDLSALAAGKEVAWHRQFGRSGLAIAVSALLAVLAAVVLWLSLSARDTLEARRAAIPEVRIPVHWEHAAAPQPPPGPAAEVVETAPALAPAPPAGEPALAAAVPSVPVPALADGRPRIALILAGLGLSAERTRAAIGRLPPAVALAFSPHGGELDTWMARAREAGHETLLMLPLEPVDYPRHDPGPNTLLVARSPAENLKRLDWVLERGSGHVGLITLDESKFDHAGPAARPVLEALQQRGLLYVHGLPAPGSALVREAQRLQLPHAVVDAVIDAAPTRKDIDDALARLEARARDQGLAVAVAAPLPVTLERLAAWLAGLAGKGIDLLPISAAVRWTPAPAAVPGG